MPPPADARGGPLANSGEPRSTGSESREHDDSPLTYRRLLGRRLYLHCWVRIGAAATILVAGMVARFGLGMVELELSTLYILAACIAIYDIGAWFVFRHFRDEDVSVPSYERVLAATYTVAVLDFLALTAAIWLVGGCRSPFVAFYILHVIVSSLLLSRRGAVLLVGLAYLLLALLVLGEWTGVAPPRMPTGAIAGAEPLSGTYALTILLVYGTLFGLTSFLLLGLTESLRLGERRIHMANDELHRLSEQRRDFLHIAVHNLKAPLGAVTMFLKNILDELGGPVTPRQQEWIVRCLKRLEDQAVFLQEMQTLSSLENEIISSTFTPIELSRVIEGLVDEYRDLAHDRRQELELSVEQHVPAVLGNARLLREAVVNYISNAIKYTPEDGQIEVRLLHPDPATVRVEVVDDGEGISEGDQRRLFEEFVRLIKPGSAAEKAKGTGLGLSLVKRIALAHGGSVGVESEVGRGSTFYLELPALLG